MPQLDEETLLRAARFCADTGRPTEVSELRHALEPLTWDELLVVKALLADPPSARPLGPFALADIGRGMSADKAVQRERGIVPPKPLEAPSEPRTKSLAVPRKLTAPRSAKTRRPKPLVVRRHADRLSPGEIPRAAPSPLPELLDLFKPEGRNTLERIIRHERAHRPAILSTLSKSYHSVEGVLDRDLDALLEHHGLTRAFAHRERDELLFALKAAQGSLAKAATSIGCRRDELQAALERLGALKDAERIREDRRNAMRSRSTLADRAATLFEAGRLAADLGLEPELVADLRARLPGHIRAMRDSGKGTEEALGLSLGLGQEQTKELLRQVGLDIRASVESPLRPRTSGIRPQNKGPSAGNRGVPSSAKSSFDRPRGGPTTGKPGLRDAWPAARGGSPSAGNRAALPSREKGSFGRPRGGPIAGKPGLNDARRAARGASPSAGNRGALPSREKGSFGRPRGGPIAGKPGLNDARPTALGGSPPAKRNGPRQAFRPTRRTR